jgi:hypothetical protein
MLQRAQYSTLNRLEEKIARDFKMFRFPSPDRPIFLEKKKKKNPDTLSDKQNFTF